MDKAKASWLHQQRRNKRLREERNTERVGERLEAAEDMMRDDDAPPEDDRERITNQIDK